MVMNQNNNYLTPLEVAEILKIKKNTVYEMIKRGDLPASKLGKQLRISRVDLDAYLGTQRPSEVSASTTAVIDGAGELDPSTIIICGQDTILDILCDKINHTGLNTTMLRLRRGSYNALYSVYQHQANIATCHMWDAATDSYNLPYISKMLPGIPIKVFHVLNRVQGFYVAKGNPKNITDFSDLNRKDIIFANREPGCGTRVLLDEKLSTLGIIGETIRGYETEKTSHLDCATAVAMKTADVALGNERAALQVPSIDFIPLQTESYDMVIPAKYMELPSYRKIVEILRSKEFQNEVQVLGGYDVTDMGKELL